MFKGLNFIPDFVESIIILFQFLLEKFKSFFPPIILFSTPLKGVKSTRANIGSGAKRLPHHTSGRYCAVFGV